MSKVGIRKILVNSRTWSTAIRSSSASACSNSLSYSTTCSTSNATSPAVVAAENTRLLPKRFSSVAVRYDDDDDDDDDDVYSDDSIKISSQLLDEIAAASNHCDTCTCDDNKKQDSEHAVTTSAVVNPRFPCGNEHHEDEVNPLPPPLPEPKYSVHKRILPPTLTAFSSEKGKDFLKEALFVDGTAESYWKLTEQFINQSDPAFCGVTTLLMCLNAMCIDPNIRWRGGWRYYGNEEVLLDRCCLSTERIRRMGITLEDFCQLGRCQGLNVELKRPEPLEKSGDNDEKKTTGYTLDEFRNDVRSVLSDKKQYPLLVVSFSRHALGQTGDGHFSPVGAYHEASDQVLILDVARFKYAPYWVGVEDLYRALQEEDSVTHKPRGWFLLYPPKNHACQHQTQEDRRPVEVVPHVGDKDICPVSSIKIDFCKANPKSLHHQ
mmetsp:Transcript_26158/g.42904  ORF Transcript_26158/g.42904 Transcript_26158/m.42904 type:complete len:435 (-) Transcript_26158:528-1832(-)|eukprot:CAMPEP_0178747828 /NCGR_PEP_ID=MMETSP0744-20121128/8548_1 /TAXON_ID=913974 /ORGANISM="Nitzschia punctata, Strain CCMP561" /LENGTH=434 /DNA_ID=CAMNT_0020401127 /DNA_START=57 /DNA_END=1361 /DNA_ORIENTATION=+